LIPESKYNNPKRRDLEMRKGMTIIFLLTGVLFSVEQPAVWFSLSADDATPVSQIVFDTLNQEIDLHIWCWFENDNDSSGVEDSAMVIHLPFDWPSTAGPDTFPLSLSVVEADWDSSSFPGASWGLWTFFCLDRDHENEDEPNLSLYQFMAYTMVFAFAMPPGTYHLGHIKFKITAQGRGGSSTWIAMDPVVPPAFLPANYSTTDAHDVSFNWDTLEVLLAVGKKEKEEKEALTSPLSVTPNPSKGEVVISFVLPKEEKIKLEVFNVAGQKIRTLLKGVFEEGPHTVVWDGKDEEGKQLKGGVYFLRLETEGGLSKKRIILK